jgi:UDP-N-acetylmuramoyl-tripeptide--D-alanyl-D-alanine ligase
MLNMTLSEIAKITQGVMIGNEARIHSITIDSRNVLPNGLFVAFSGEKVDGHNFLNQAMKDGAVGALVERHVDSLLPQIVVENAAKALADIAREYRKSYRGKIISVTGSSGKTTTKEMLVSILNVNTKVIATQGNQNNEIGVPLTVLNLNESSDYAVIEMGAAQQGDIAYLMHIADPDITAITNVGSAHIGRFGSEKMIAQTKSEIYAALKSTGSAVVNIDDKYANDWLLLLKNHVIKTFSLENINADIYASNIVCSTENTHFVLHSEGESLDVFLPVPGKHNVSNALCSTALALMAGVSLDDVVIGLSRFSSVSSRLMKYKGFWGGVLIDDSYNANPSSVRAAIDVLSSYHETKILVLGDMAELGDMSKVAHVDIGLYAKKTGIEKLVSCGVDSAAASEAFGANAMHFDNKASLISYLKKQLSAGEVVLVKGSRSSALEEVVESLMKKVIS